jgi:hypothetical protein
MTIRDIDDFISSLWDWGILKGCFGDTKIEPTDIDGIVERNGHFLVLETKKPGNPLVQGQRIMFNRLLELKMFTVLIIWGHPGCPEKMLIMYPPPYPAKEIECDRDMLRQVVSRWFDYANKCTRDSRVTLTH